MSDNQNQPNQQNGKQSVPHKKGDRDAEQEGLDIDDVDEEEITQRTPRMGDPQRPSGDRKP